MPEIRSASRCTGALEPCASPTSRMMPASNVCSPTPVALQRNAPCPLAVAAKTRSPACLPTGMLSPVSIASLTLDWPSTTSPSTGTFSPGRTRKTSPGISAPTGSSIHSPSRSTRAVFGCSRISASMASDVRALARASSSLPSSTSVITAAPASK